MSHYYTPLGDKIHHGGYNPLGEVGGLKSTGGYTINYFFCKECPGYRFPSQIIQEFGHQKVELVPGGTTRFVYWMQLLSVLTG